MSDNHSNSPTDLEREDLEQTLACVDQITREFDNMTSQLLMDNAEIAVLSQDRRCSTTKEFMIHLVPEHEIAQFEYLILPLIEELDPNVAAIANDDFSGGAFRYYLFFSESSILQRTPLSRLNIPELFYNKYYWFLLFTKLHQIRHGYDGGLEQQAFKLLETAPSNVNWNLLEEIHKRVEHEISNL